VGCGHLLRWLLLHGGLLLHHPGGKRRLTHPHDQATPGQTSGSEQTSEPEQESRRGNRLQPRSRQRHSAFGPILSPDPRRPPDGGCRSQAESWSPEGNVEARFQGWRLLADRVEVIEPSRTVYASGRLRLFKGDQMLQASRLRYSQLEGSGELEDIYGVIDQEVVDRELKALRQPGEPAAPHARGAPIQGFACPRAAAAPANNVPCWNCCLPAGCRCQLMPAPRGCPGAEAPAAAARSLREC
jgi:hypothetical protein